ncbi:tetratricopeptide repeat protein [Parvularcula marina]|uniref:Tetratricopeptide repeat protein n=1 Tax=Parvularcula marina TaxID=2292771 RepID=A0A371RFB6_9PROT|nr:tetratricopeptide repeat protein [Parvularcula marina]RFB04136.1 hypothetical protein DX908_01875 [Parvularcula marina]
MALKWILAGSAGIAALTGVTLNVEWQPQDDGVSFIPPIAFSSALCGGKDGLAARRQFFVSAAAAYAAALPEVTSDGSISDETLSRLGFEITTSSPEAQLWFDRGMALVYGFNHEAAATAFRKAQTADPDCAMCFWAEGLAYGPNINLPMDEIAGAKAIAATQKAAELSGNASERERALIDALMKRYSDDPEADRGALDLAFAEAMDEVALLYPEDNVIAVIAAEANMDTQAWDYWEVDGLTPKGRSARTLSLLEGILARKPDYAPAIHLYIHLTEASNNPYRAVPYADELAALAPELGHLVHMPAHTYYRVGDWKKSISHNIAAVAADEAFLANNEASVIYEYGYYTHNLHFLLTSAQTGGDSETALALAKKLDEKLPLEMATSAPWIQPVKAAPYYTMAQFGAPGDVLAMEDPGDDIPFLKAAWHYARGEALASMARTDDARAEAAAIASIAANTDFSELIGGGVPADGVLEVSRLTILARAAAAEGDYETAVEAMERAVILQDGFPYMEPPFWYYPSKQTLAAMVLLTGDHDRARQLFHETLVQSPNNAWALFGLAEAYRREGERSGAKLADKLFKDAWLGERGTRPKLMHL